MQRLRQPGPPAGQELHRTVDYRVYALLRVTAADGNLRRRTPIVSCAAVGFMLNRQPNTIAFGKQSWRLTCWAVADLCMTHSLHGHHYEPAAMRVIRQSDVNGELRTALGME